MPKKLLIANGTIDEFISLNANAPIGIKVFVSVQIDSSSSWEEAAKNIFELIHEKWPDRNVLFGGLWHSSSYRCFNGYIYSDGLYGAIQLLDFSPQNNYLFFLKNGVVTKSNIS